MQNGSNAALSVASRDGLSPHPGSHYRQGHDGASQANMVYATPPSSALLLRDLRAHIHGCAQSCVRDRRERPGGSRRLDGVETSEFYLIPRCGTA